jgi:hypothetical protein
MTVTTNTPLGFIGLGIMGGAMAKNLLKAGFKGTVPNRSRGKVDDLIKAGAQDGGSPAGVARASEVLLLCVPDTPDVEKVLFGDDGVIHGIARDAVVIDCSTISATATAEFAARLRANGVHMVDSPSLRSAPASPADPICRSPRWARRCWPACARPAARNSTMQRWDCCSTICRGSSADGGAANVPRCSSSA